MSTLTVDLRGASVVDGKQLTFVAPCDCTGVTGLKIGDDIYELVDATGNLIASNVTHFAKDSMVSVIVCTQSKKAYIQNSANKLFVDVVPTVDSANFVTSGTIYDALANKLDKDGGALAADPTEPMQPATKQYVDTQIANLGGFVASDTAPEKKNLLWIDTAENIMKYWNGTEWFAIGAVYG